MLTDKEMDEIVLRAKKSMTDEQIKDAVRRCSYGGKEYVDMSLRREPTNGTSNTMQKM